MTRSMMVRGWAVTACVGVMLGLTAGCDDTTVPDNTAPLLKLETFGALRSVRIESSDNGAATLRARSDDNVNIAVTANDPESGIRAVRVRGHLDSVCIPQSGSQKVTVREPVGEVASASGSPEGVMTHRFRVDVAARRSVCPVSTKFYELAGELIASAENGKGAETVLGTLTFLSFGPDLVSIGTFNLRWVGHWGDDQFAFWGRELGRQTNALVLTEVPNLHQAQVFATAAGLPHLYVFEDVAVLSEGPIRDIKTHQVDPVEALPSAHSNILSVQTDLGGFPHQIIGMHWGIRDVANELMVGWVSSPSRVEAAQRALALLDPAARVTFVAGDFNAYSGVGPQLMEGTTAEISLLQTKLTDPFISMGPGLPFCSNQRIDYVMFRGMVTPQRFDSCSPHNGPSDHPFVVTTFAAG